MNAFTGAQNNSGEKSGAMNQAMFGAALVLVVYLSLLFIEIVYKYINRLSMNRTNLLPYTYNIDDKTKTLIQNPNVVGSMPISLSDNEKSGIEFSYTFYLHVHPSTFRTEEGLLHIFHKGYTTQFPLLAPGVYMRSETNTLRIYMNTYKTWNNYIEVDNIPISKWVHVTIVCKDNSLEVYINGNLKRKLSFDGFAPYQNYEDIICFSQRKLTFKKVAIQSLSSDLTVFGPMKGMLSRLSYFSYALCYAEIQQLMNEGPSNKMDSSLNADVPPYLADTWWTNGF
jgi:hypothetical protein